MNLKVYIAAKRARWAYINIKYITLIFTYTNVGKSLTTFHYYYSLAVTYLDSTAKVGLVRLLGSRSAPAVREDVCLFTFHPTKYVIHFTFKTCGNDHEYHFWLHHSFKVLTPHSLPIWSWPVAKSEYKVSEQFTASVGTSNT